MRRDVSDQHQLLINWEGRYPGQVFYAAPCLCDNVAFNNAYNTASVVSSSILFSPILIGPLPDDKVHTIAYRPGLPYGYFFSQPKQVEAEIFESVTSRLRRTFKDKDVGDFRAMAQEVRQAVLEAASPIWRQAEDAVAGRVRQALPPIGADGSGSQPDREQARLDVLVAREIACIDMGIDLVIAQPRWRVRAPPKQALASAVSAAAPQLVRAMDGTRRSRLKHERNPNPVRTAVSA